ncbi:MAG TPA: acetate--CoA ligase family protein [Thermoanaerobaculia bacterium]|nr:acetate--CoA ligase family protein [Thermoanaerobaculia bacterium]
MDATAETGIRRVCEAARAEGRSRLTELEGLAVARAFGLAVPRTLRIAGARESGTIDLGELPGERVVVKAISSAIVHKSELGAIAVVDRRPEAVVRAVEAMAARLRGRDLEGYAVQELVEHDAGLGGELLLGIRWSEAFGPVVALGLGGLDAEALAGGLPPLLLSAAAPPSDLPALIAAHPTTAPLLRPSRGRPPRWPAGELVALVERALDLAVRLCPDPIAEVEFNPIVRSARGTVALDAAARLGAPAAWDPPRPLDRIGRLLRPRTVAVVGVSERPNPGHRVVRSLLAAGFPAARIRIVKPGPDELLGCVCVPSIEALPEPVDLLVVSIAADEVPDLVERTLDRGLAASLILLSGGLGETAGSAERVSRIRSALARARAGSGDGPVVNGGNCLGVRSVPGRLDTLFIPPHKLRFPSGPPDPVALISQSGAFAIARATWQPRLNPRELVTVGNQLDLTVGDHLAFLAEDPALAVFGVYVEGFRPGDGERLLAATGRITGSGRSVVLYLAGRTGEGADAAASHTASIAGDRRVAVDLLRAAGALVADSLEEFDDLLMLATRLAGRAAAGNRLGAVSNAGFECVAIADSLGPFELAGLSAPTRERLAALLARKRLDGVVSVRNPLDLTPIADDDAFAEATRAVLEDPTVDLGIVGCVPLTGALATLPRDERWTEDLEGPAAVAGRLGRLWRETTRPWLAVVDSGAPYDPFADRLAAAGVPVFRHADRALARLAAWFRAAR